MSASFFLTEAMVWLNRSDKRMYETLAAFWGGGGGAVRSGNPKPLTTRVFGSGSLFSAVLVA